MRPAVRRAGPDGARRLWIKPLLGATRAMIEADLVSAGQPWREDRSNLDPRYTRSRVRHEAVPALGRALLPRAGAARARELLALRAARATAAARDAERVIGRLAARVLPARTRSGRDDAAIPAARLARPAEGAAARRPRAGLARAPRSRARPHRPALHRARTPH